jgi:hypothetical protein
MSREKYLNKEECPVVSQGNLQELSLLTTVFLGTLKLVFKQGAHAWHRKGLKAPIHGISASERAGHPSA